MRRPTLAFYLLSATFLLACSGDFWRSCTSTVVGKTVETTKEVTTGVAEGIEEGRKSGESLDGATHASSMADLGEGGAITVHAIEGEEGATSCQVTLALENKGDVPLRFLSLEVSVLDKDGFVQHPTNHESREVTVPPRAKERATYTFDTAADQVGTVRVWDTDLALPQGNPAQP